MPFIESRALVTVLVAWTIAQIGIGGINLSEIFLARNDYETGNFGFGLMIGAAGVGLIVGGLWARSAAQLVGMRSAYPRALLVFAAGTLGAAVAPNVWVGCCALFVYGLGNGVAVVLNITLVQRGAPDRVRGRALTAIIAINSAMLLAVFFLVGPADRRRRRTRRLRDLGRRPRPRRGGSRVAAAARGRRVTGRRDWTRERLREAIRAGDRRALARAITLVENGDPLAYDVVPDLYPQTGGAYSVGLTGPPGVGKSSLASVLVRLVRAEGRTVGVISVDPSSPFTQGALLGDRIRLTDHFLDPEVFIRSMGTRGHLGGLAEATLQALLLLDAAGKELVFLETVGAGQSEVGVLSIADTVVLVLMPGSGDSIQALKAGIMEIPDVIAINKRDHPLAKTMLGEVRQVLSLGPKGGWRPPVVLTEAIRGEGIDDLWEQVAAHRAWLEEQGKLEERRRRNLSREVFQVASVRARRHLEDAVRDDPELRRLLDEVQARRLDPLTAVREILEQVFRIG